MNFTEYCIYTRNYSALNTINEYTKQFGIFDRVKNTASLLGNKVKSMDLGTKLSNAANWTRDRIESLDLGSKLSTAQKMAHNLKNKTMNATGISGLINAKNTLNKRMGMSNSDILKNLMSKEGRYKMLRGLGYAKSAADNLNELRKHEDFIDDYRGNDTAKSIKTQNSIDRRVDALNELIKGQDNVNRKRAEKRAQIIRDAHDLIGDNAYGHLMNELKRESEKSENKPVVLKKRI